MTDAAAPVASALRFDGVHGLDGPVRSRPRRPSWRGRWPLGWRLAGRLRLGLGGGGARGLAVYLVAPIVATIAVASWHTPGRFVAAGDIGPFVRDGLAADVGSLWGYGLTGAGSATAEVARLPELAVYEAANALGVAPELAQLAFFWLWLAGASAACILLARQLVTSTAAHIAVGVLAIANPMMAVNLPNPLVPVALCTLALFAAALVRAARGVGSVRVTVLATLPASYLAINPPTLAVVGLVCVGAFAAATVFSPSQRRRLGRHAAAVVPLAALAHAWWLVPAAIVYAGGGGAAVAAVTDPEAWSWTHVNNSLGNVTTLTAHWGWGMHEYLPFSRDLDRLPMSPLRWALPTLVAMAPLAAATHPRRRIAVVAVGVAIACIIIGKGLHGPAAGLNVELYRRVTGMWLLREPMSKVGPVLLLAYLVGAAVAVDGVVARLRAAPRRRAGSGLAALAALVAAAVVFGHPVLTGGVAPENRTPLPSSRVAVPDGWHHLAAALNGDATAGKALVLPTLPFYQATTTWGFHGAATLPRDLLERPTLLGLPGGYFADDPVVTGLIDVVAVATDRARIGRALEALGVSHVVVRTDLSDAQAVRPIADPDALLDRLQRTGLFGAPLDFGVATVLRRIGPTGGAAVFSDAATVAASTAGGTARAVASLPDDVAAVADGWGVDISTTVFDGDAGQLDATLQVPADGRYQLRAVPHVGLTALVAATPTGAMVDPRLTLRVDGDVVTESRPQDVPGAGGTPVALTVNGTPTVLGDEPVAVDLATGSVLRVLSSDGAPRPVTAWSDVSDCNAEDDRDPAIAASVVKGTLVLSANRHAACVNAPVDVTGPSLVRFDVRITRGQAARACLWSDADSTCAWEHTIDASANDGWRSVGEVVDVPADARLFLYADAGTEPATTRYRNVELVPLVAGPAAAVAGLPGAEVDLTRGGHVLQLTQPSLDVLGAARVGPPSEVSNCNARDEATVLTASVANGVVRLEANGDAACVHHPVAPLAPGVSYDVRFEYRTLSPAAARWCLWVDGADRCANDVQGLAPSPVWTVHRDRIVVPEGATDVRLFVYADGDAERNGDSTINEYRRPSIRVASPMTVSLTDTAADADGGAGGGEDGGAVLRWSGHPSPERWRADVASGGTPFVLALPDAADPAWVLEGLPTEATARATVVDGYRQGWVVSGLVGDATVTARYGPARYALVGRWASVVVVGALLVPWSRRRRRGGRR